MEEKYIVNDVLENMKLSLKEYENIIVDTSNIEFRQMLQNLRNSDENFQYELEKLAMTKGYYTETELVNKNQIQNLRNELINNA